MSNESNNNDKNVFDQAGEAVQSNLKGAGDKLNEFKDQAASKAGEVKGQAEKSLQDLQKPEADKQANGEPTVGERVGDFVNSAKDTTGKVMTDAKEKFDEAFSKDDNKKN